MSADPEFWSPTIDTLDKEEKFKSLWEKLLDDPKIQSVRSLFFFLLLI